MTRKKKIKMEEVFSFSNVFNGENEHCEKKLLEYFDNPNPITLEIGCGRGDYSINMAKKFPARNFAGLDIKGERIWNGAKSAEETGLNNVAFIVSNANILPEIFKNNKIDEIWIPFPDPFPRKKNRRKRLVSPEYLERYRKILIAGGNINFKTDDDFLFDYAVEILEAENIIPEICTSDLYNSAFDISELEIKTKYEEAHLAGGKTIKFIRFKLNNNGSN